VADPKQPLRNKQPIDHEAALAAISKWIVQSQAKRQQTLVFKVSLDSRDLITSVRFQPAEFGIA
jgi:hypothetical protein